MPNLPYVITIHTYILITFEGLDIGVKLLLFLAFSVLVANPKKLLYTVANPTRGLLNRGGGKESDGAPPSPPHAARSEKLR